MRGVDLKGSEITGTLDLRGAKLHKDADGYALNLSLANIAGDVQADLLQADGEIRAVGATIKGQLNLSGAKLHTPGTPDRYALIFSFAEIGGVSAEDGFEADGEIKAIGARIKGQLVLTGAKLRNRNPDGHALILDVAEITGGVFAAFAFEADGEIHAIGATIKGTLRLVGAKLRNTLILDHADIAGDVQADLLQADGEIRAIGATIKGTLRLVGAKLRNRNPDGDALNLDGAEITRGVFARDGFQAHGQIRAVGATIKGRFDLRGATLHNPNGDALNLDDAEITTVSAGAGFQADGQIRAVGATIKSQLNLRGATLHKSSKPDSYALVLDGRGDHR